MHPRDEDAYPIGTVVRIRKTGQFAIIRQLTFQYNGHGFLNYLGEVDGRDGLYALYHGDIDLECPAEPAAAGSGFQ